MRGEGFGVGVGEVWGDGCGVRGGCGVMDVG